ncbi:MAG: amino acid adenylation domain-containing protein, partial [bacterium]|nr:amino acid adenylation domain-containing protein [bacterium]
LECDYNTDVFDATTIERFVGHFHVLLEGIVSHPTHILSQLPLLTEAEQQQLLAWNDTATDDPLDKTIIDLFEQQVEKTPSNIAVVFEEHHLTYQQLNEKANQLAHHILRLTPQAGASTGSATGSSHPLIAIAVERSVEMVIGILGILKAGGAYVPIDPTYPAARIQSMLEDSAAPLLLTQNHLKAELSLEALTPAGVVICLDDADFANQPTDNPDVTRDAHDVAYVIYTSGSTGKPKGVMIEQNGFANHCCAMIRALSLTDADIIAQTAPIGFDISVWQIVTMLLIGGKIHIIGHDILHEPAQFLGEIHQRHISVLQVVPSLLRVMLDMSDSGVSTLSSLRWLLVTGEAFPHHLCRQWVERYPEIPFMNAYGPAECSDDVTLYPNNGHHSGHADASRDMLTTTVPIGSPIDNTRVYILDRHQNPVPPGIPGELCVAGVGLARGYLNRPDLSNEKFIDVELFGATERIYTTGDLARWLPDGNLEYLGRIDSQVKLRGFRIELGEIEAVLSQHDAVQDAVVTLYDADDNKRLAAYVTVKSAQFEDSRFTELRDWLNVRLPDYMIPSHFTVLERLPLTPNGKIDRNALPAPSSDSTAGTKPVTPTEELLAGVWAGILTRDVINRDDHFFELGGHSLLATRLTARIRDAFQVELSVRAVFEHPRLSRLATQIDAAAREVSVPPISPQPAASKPVLSYAQQRLWFLHQFEASDSATYNMPTALRLQGDLDVAAFQSSLSWVLQRHDSLRTIFPTQQGHASVQIVDLEDLDVVVIHDVTNLSSTAQAVEVQHRANRHAVAPFDLAWGPLFKVELLLLDPQQSVVLLNLHHIISDDWSEGIFIRDWQHAYTAFARGEQPSLPSLAIQYSDYAAWQREWLQGDLLQHHVAYWRGQLTGAPELLELPTDNPRPPQQSYQGAQYARHLSPTLSQAAFNLSRQHGVSLFMTLLTTFTILLSRYSRQNDVCVGSPIANRTHSQTEDLMGFFVNTLVLRSRIRPQSRCLDLLHATRTTCLEAYAHQDLPFEMLVEQLQPTRSLSHSPLVQVMLVLNTDPTEFTLPGVDVTTLEVDDPIAKFDLTLNVKEQHGELDCVWEYATDLFSPDTIERMANHFEVLLTALVEHPEQSISQLPMLTEAEIRQLQTWNDTATDYPQDTTIVDAFEQQVEKTPNNIAVVFEDQQLTYRQLNEKANQLAHHVLRLTPQAGASTGSATYSTGSATCSSHPFIAIVVERSVEMVIGVLGILKACGAYVSIDPSYPATRIQYMLEDS